MQIWSEQWTCYNKCENLVMQFMVWCREPGHLFLKKISVDAGVWSFLRDPHWRCPQEALEKYRVDRHLSIRLEWLTQEIAWRMESRDEEAGHIQWHRPLRTWWRAERVINMREKLKRPECGSTQEACVGGECVSRWKQVLGVQVGQEKSILGKKLWEGYFSV